ncbi:MAG: hypothetical protein LBM70_06495 [Victivallales bacterium]|jgi:hypothetical protein|nr:hypothetical protein [Victivallales bacterium]
MSELVEKDLSLREISPIAQIAEKIGGILCGAILPGIFLGNMFIRGIKEVPIGVWGISAIVFAVFSISVILGALLIVALERKSADYRNKTLLLGVLVLILYVLDFNSSVAIVWCGIISGGYLAALPRQRVSMRDFFGVFFALSAVISVKNGYFSTIISPIIIPLLFGSIILWLKTSWKARIFMVLALCGFTIVLWCSVVLGYNVFSQQRPTVEIRAKNTASALPALLMTDSDLCRILLIGEDDSSLPEIWLEMPFVTQIDSISWQGAASSKIENPRFKRYKAQAGRAIFALIPHYNLVYIEQLPDNKRVAQRAFVQELWNHLASDAVLILPGADRSFLPDSAQVVALPGAKGDKIAASHRTLSTDLDLLDSRLQELLKPFESETTLPAGLLSALYPSDKPPGIPSSDDGFARPQGDCPMWMYVAFLGALIVYGAIRLWRGRFQKNQCQFELVENSAGLTLILLAAYEAMSSGELFTGISSDYLWGCVGLSVIVLPLRNRATQLLAFVAICLPGAWLLRQGVVPEELLWLIVTVIVAITSGTIQNRIVSVFAVSGVRGVIFSALGGIVGGGLYLGLGIYAENSLLFVILTAAWLRLAWALKL